MNSKRLSVDNGDLLSLKAGTVLTTEEIRLAELISYGFGAYIENNRRALAQHLIKRDEIIDGIQGAGTEPTSEPPKLTRQQTERVEEIRRGYQQECDSFADIQLNTIDFGLNHLRAIIEPAVARRTRRDEAAVLFDDSIELKSEDIFGPPKSANFPKTTVEDKLLGFIDASVESIKLLRLKNWPMGSFEQKNNESGAALSPMEEFHHVCELLSGSVDLGINTLRRSLPRVTRAASLAVNEKKPLKVQLDLEIAAFTSFSRVLLHDYQKECEYCNQAAQHIKDLMGGRKHIESLLTEEERNRVTFFLIIRDSIDITSDQTLVEKGTQTLKQIPELCKKARELNIDLGISNESGNVATLLSELETLTVEEIKGIPQITGLLEVASGKFRKLKESYDEHQRAIWSRDGMRRATGVLPAGGTIGIRSDGTFGPLVILDGQERDGSTPHIRAALFRFFRENLGNSGAGGAGPSSKGPLQGPDGK